MSASAESSASRAAATIEMENPAAVEAGLLARCEAAVELARAAGADEAEAFASARRSTSVALEKGDLQLARVSASEGLGLRVFVGGRLGFASTNQLDGDGLRRLAEQAVGLARLSPADPKAGLLAGEALAGLGGAVDPGLWQLGVEPVVELARGLLEAVRGRDPRLSLDASEVQVAAGSGAVLSSRGARAAESSAGLGASVFGMAVDGDDVGGFDYRSDWTRRPDGLPARIEDLVRRFADAALGNLGAGRAESYSGPVLFTPEAFVSMFLSPLLGAISALAVQRGRSALGGRLGEPIGVPGFHLRDDPADLDLSGASAFDREGQAARPMDLVSGGVLRTYLYNGQAARQEDLAAGTGHAQGGSRGVPGLGPHALVLEPGDGGDERDLARTLGRGLLVGRFSGTVDPTSGDFSGVAKSARWVEGGEIVRPVGETLLAGNAFEGLRSILALSSRSERLSGSARVPWALVDGVRVTAG